jgi:hypothetical protein
MMKIASRSFTNLEESHANILACSLPFLLWVPRCLFLTFRVCFPLQRPELFFMMMNRVEI